MNADAGFIFLVEMALKSALILLLALGLAAMLGRATASLRGTVYAAAFYALACLPAASVLLPSIPLLPAGPEWGQARPTQSEFGGNSAAIPSLPPAVGAATKERSQRIEGSKIGTGTQASWQLGILILWIAVAWFLLARLGIIYLRAGQEARSAHRIRTGPWIELLASLRAALGLRRPVRLAINPRCQSPLSFGSRRPVILLPKRCESWSTERMKLVLLHELAHIRRGDFLTQLVMQITTAIWWFNPLCYWVAARLVRDRERACDDVVLLQGHAAAHYAQHLLAIAKNLRTVRASAMVAMAHHSKLEERIMSILDRGQRRRSSAAISTLTMLLVAALTLPLAAAQLRAAPELEVRPSRQPMEPSTPGLANEPVSPLPSPLEPHPSTSMRESGPEPYKAFSAAAPSGRNSSRQLTASQERSAREAGLYDHFSEADVRHLMARQIPVEALLRYGEAGLWDRFSAHDLGFLVHERVEPEQLLVFREVGMLDRFSAHDLGYLIAKTVDVDYLATFKSASLDHRYSAHDMAYLYGKEVPVEFLTRLDHIGLGDRYSAHDAAYLYQKQVPIEYLTRLQKDGLIDRYSAHDAAYLAQKDVSLDYLKAISTAGLIHRYSAHDVAYLSGRQVSLDYLSGLREVGLEGRFSAHDAAHLFHQDTPLEFLALVDEAGLADRYSAHDLAHLNRSNVNVQYLEALDDAGFIQRFSAHDASHLFANQIPMDHLMSFEQEGLIQDFSAYDLSALFHQPVPFEFIHELKRENLLHYLSGSDLAYIHQKGVTLQQIRAAVAAGKFSGTRDKDTIRRIFP